MKKWLTGLLATNILIFGYSCVGESALRVADPFGSLQIDDIPSDLQELAGAINAELDEAICWESGDVWRENERRMLLQYCQERDLPGQLTGRVTRTVDDLIRHLDLFSSDLPFKVVLLEESDILSHLRGKDAFVYHPEKCKPGLECELVIEGGAVDGDELVFSSVVRAVDGQGAKRAVAAGLLSYPMYLRAATSMIGIPVRVKEGEDWREPLEDQLMEMLDAVVSADFSPCDEVAYQWVDFLIISAGFRSVADELIPLFSQFESPSALADFLTLEVLKRIRPDIPSETVLLKRLEMELQVLEENEPEDVDAGGLSAFWDYVELQSISSAGTEMLH